MAIVILISFIVIVVFRLKMKRLRARRLARYIEQQYRQGSLRWLQKTFVRDLIVA